VKGIPRLLFFLFWYLWDLWYFWYLWSLWFFWYLWYFWFLWPFWFLRSSQTMELSDASQHRQPDL
jgi:hypothetical protein